MNKTPMEFFTLLTTNSLNLGDYHKGSVINTELIVEDMYRHYIASGLPFNEWYNALLADCADCDQDCSKCDKPFYPKFGPIAILTIDQLKAAAYGGQDFYIVMAGGVARSSKFICWHPEKGKHGKFFIRNGVDDSEEYVAPENLAKKTSIIEAMKCKAFFKDKD